MQPITSIDEGIYNNLVKATPQELLEAAIHFYSKNNPELERWLRLGFALAQPNGWQNVAPVWLTDVQNERLFDE